MKALRLLLGVVGLFLLFLLVSLVYYGVAYLSMELDFRPSFFVIFPHGKAAPFDAASTTETEPVTSDEYPQASYSPLPNGAVQ